jgi:hypothetical protein
MSTSLQAYSPAPAPQAASTTPGPLFSLGQVCFTPGALDALADNEQIPLTFLARHVTGDWQELCQEDQETNREALTCGARIFSAFAMKNGAKLWVITESDRSVTTLLLPSEY